MSSIFSPLDPQTVKFRDNTSGRYALKDYRMNIQLDEGGNRIHSLDMSHGKPIDFIYGYDNIESPESIYISSLLDAEDNSLDFGRFHIYGSIAEKHLKMIATFLNKINSVETLRLESEDLSNIEDVAKHIFRLKRDKKAKFISYTPADAVDTRNVLSQSEGKVDKISRKNLDGLVLHTAHLVDANNWFRDNFEKLNESGLLELRIQGRIDNRLKTLIFERLISTRTLRCLILDGCVLSDINSLKNCNIPRLDILSMRNLEAIPGGDGNKNILRFVLGLEFLNRLGVDIDILNGNISDVEVEWVREINPKYNILGAPGMRKTDNVSNLDIFPSGHKGMKVRPESLLRLGNSRAKLIDTKLNYREEYKNILWRVKDSEKTIGFNKEPQKTDGKAI